MGEFLKRAAIAAAAVVLLAGCDATGAFSVVTCRPQLDKVLRGARIDTKIISPNEEMLGFTYDDGRGYFTEHWVDFNSSSGRCVVTGHLPGQD